MVICNLFFSFQKDMFLERDGCSAQPLAKRYTDTRKLEEDPYAYRICLSEFLYLSPLMLQTRQISPTEHGGCSHKHNQL